MEFDIYSAKNLEHITTELMADLKMGKTDEWQDFLVAQFALININSPTLYMME